MTLPAGEHRLELRREGFRPIQKSFTIRSGEILDQLLVLTALGTGTVTIHLESAPWAYFRIDGAEEMELPSAPIRLSEGRYSLRVYREGFHEVTQDFHVLPGQDTPVRVRLEEAIKQEEHR
jgi:hypothetical protein